MWALSASQQGAHSLWSLDDLDPFVQLAALSQLVDGVGLGLVLDVHATRPSALVAKAIATLDVISGGRLQVAATPSPFTDAVAHGLLQWQPHPVQQPFAFWHLGGTANDRRVAIVDGGGSELNVELLVSRKYLAF